MKSVLSFLVLGIFISSLFAIEPVNGNMGLLRDGIAGTQKKDYAIAFDILLRRISTKKAMIGTLNYYDEIDAIMDDFLAHKLDYIMLNPYFFLENQKKLQGKVSLYGSVRKYKNKFEKMFIVVAKDSDINDITDLKAKKIMLKDDNYMGKVVLNKALLESKIHQSYIGYIDKIITVNTHSRALLQLYFAKTDAAIIPQYAYDLMCDMNPAVKKRTKIIYKTDALFMPIMSLMHIKSSPVLVARVKETAKSFHQSAEGQNLLDLFKMTNLDTLEYEELQKLREYYDEYKKLQKKYGDEKL
jgi:ABC-type phosphate/phosphonate transport system substrate-binding protein